MIAFITCKSFQSLQIQVQTISILTTRFSFLLSGFSFHAVPFHRRRNTGKAGSLLPLPLNWLEAWSQLPRLL